MSQYQSKVYRPEGDADRLVVADGGVIQIKTGGKIVADDGSQAAGIELTDSTGGSAGDTIAAVSGSGADTAINNNFASLTTAVNKIIAALQDTGIMAEPPSGS